MRRLVLAEVSRLWSRRLTWVAMVVLLLAVAGLQVAVLQSVRPLTAAELAQGQAQYEEAKQQYDVEAEVRAEEQQDCLDQGNPPDVCSFEGPSPEDFAPRFVIEFSDVAPVVLTVMVFAVTLGFLFLGASFIGAEYSSGALANWMSFIPQRGQVFSSKLIALVLSAALVSAAVSALTLGVAVVIARAVGARVSGVGRLAELGGRGVVVAVIGAVLGFTLAMLTRHTIAAAGMLLGTLLVSYIFNILTFAIPSLQGIKPWLPEVNLQAFLNHGYQYETYDTAITESGSEPQVVQHTISFAHGAGYWGVVLTVFIVGTFLLFRRRDIN